MKRKKYVSWIANDTDVILQPSHRNLLMLNGTETVKQRETKQFNQSYWTSMISLSTNKDRLWIAFVRKAIFFSRKEILFAGEIKKLWKTTKDVPLFEKCRLLLKVNLFIFEQIFIYLLC